MRHVGRPAGSLCLAEAHVHAAPRSVDEQRRPARLMQFFPRTTRARIAFGSGQALFASPVTLHACLRPGLSGCDAEGVRGEAACLHLNWGAIVMVPDTIVPLNPISSASTAQGDCADDGQALQWAIIAVQVGAHEILAHCPPVYIVY